MEQDIEGKHKDTFLLFPMKFCWHNALIQKTPKTPKQWISYSDKTLASLAKEKCAKKKHARNQRVRVLIFSRGNCVFLALPATRELRKISRDSLSASREAGAQETQQGQNSQHLPFHRRLRMSRSLCRASLACPAQSSHQVTKIYQNQEHCLDVDWQQHSDTCSSRPGTEALLQLSHSTRELWVGVKQLENHKPTTGWLSEMTGDFCFEPVCD